MFVSIAGSTFNSFRINQANGVLVLINKPWCRCIRKPRSYYLHRTNIAAIHKGRYVNLIWLIMTSLAFFTAIMHKDAREVWTLLGATTGGYTVYLYYQARLTIFVGNLTYHSTWCMDNLDDITRWYSNRSDSSNLSNIELV